MNLPQKELETISAAHDAHAINALKGEAIAAEFITALKALAANPAALDNFQCYLSYHFSAWLNKHANTPEAITAELKHFSNIGD